VRSKMEVFFHRQHEYEFLTKMGAPSMLINKQRKLRREILNDLKKDDIDGRAYFKSAKGQAEYLLFVADRETHRNAMNKCDVCEFFVFQAKGNELEEYLCTQFDDWGVINCPHFRDCGLDDHGRMSLFLDRCPKCTHHCFTGEGIGKDHCRLKLSMIAPICSGFKSK